MTLEEAREIIESRLNPSTESIKLFKNSRGYNWEIKILEINIDRLQDIDEKLRELFNDE